MKTKSRIGRPPLPEGEAKARMFCLRLSPDERAAIDVAAGTAGESASEWARRVLLAAALIDRR